MNLQKQAKDYLQNDLKPVRLSIAINVFIGIGILLLSGCEALPDDPDPSAGSTTPDDPDPSAGSTTPDDPDPSAGSTTPDDPDPSAGSTTPDDPDPSAGSTTPDDPDPSAGSTTPDDPDPSAGSTTPDDPDPSAGSTTPDDPDPSAGSTTPDDPDPSAGSTTTACVNDDTQESETVCGLNNEGVLIQRCVDEIWVDTDECTGQDICINDGLQDSSTTCGFNDDGVLIQRCTDGAWVDTDECTGQDVCINDGLQDSSTTCGLNDEGFLIQRCTEGVWVDTEGCTGQDICINDGLQDSSTICGFNDDGVLIQRCTDGVWVNTDECTGQDICINDGLQDSSTTCGLNDEGFLIQRCTEGVWVDTEGCTGQDICINDGLQDSSTICGFNDEGVLIQRCTDGVWVNTDECTGQDVCINDGLQDSSTTCGLNDEGFLIQRCTEGVWVNTDECTGQDICINDGLQDGSTTCGFNDEGVLIQRCTDGAWVDTDECTGQDLCTNGNTQAGTTACGFNDTGVLNQQCVSGGWVDTEECVGESCDGEGEFTVCVEGEPGKVFNTDLCGNPTTMATRCSASLTCEVNSGDGQAYCNCPLTGNNRCLLGGTLSTLYEATSIVKERSCANAVDEPTDLIEECGFGTVCFQEEGFNDGEALCHRSVDSSQADKPYYDFSCGTFSMWLRNPTSLEIDCRCRVVGDGQGGAGGTIGGSNGYVDPNNIDIDNGGYPGGPIINCSTPGAMADTEWPIDYGTGPNFNAWYQQNASGASWFSGVVNAETREMFAIVRWTNPQYTRSGTVVAWNLDTGDRRVISGLYPDPRLGQAEYGSGYMSPAVGNSTSVTEQPLSGANVIRLAPNGQLYVFGGGTGEGTSSEREIVRVDPTTGERTLIWRSRTDDDDDQINAGFGQCLRPDAYGRVQSVGINAQAFEVGANGEFYLSMRGTREGDGLISISADGATCTFISRWGGLGHSPGGGADPVPAPDQIGNGFLLQFPVKGLLYHNDTIYGVSNDDLYSFNITTGQRIKESYAVSSYGGMGISNMFWDETRSVIWAVGTVAKFVGAIVDLETGRRESIFSDTGFQDYGAAAILRSDYEQARSITSPPTMLGSNSNSIGYGGFVLDPDNNDIVFAVLKSGGLMKMELSTFNNFVFSW